MPMLHEQFQQHRYVLKAGVGRQALLPVAADPLVELTADVGQQTIPELIKSPADTVAVGDGHGEGIRGGWAGRDRSG